MSEDRVEYGALSAEEICSRLSAWAEAARATTPGAGTGAVAVTKSDLLGRLIRGGEKAPSQTPCPVHNGQWSGCDTGWPGSNVVRVDGVDGCAQAQPGWSSRRHRNPASWATRGAQYGRITSPSQVRSPQRACRRQDRHRLWCAPA